IEYVGEHLVYPENAKKEGLEGMVVIRFSVLKTGKVDDVNILRDIGKGCGEAGASVIRNMNDDGIKWIPGQQRGKKVNVQFTLPIKFKLPEVPPAPEAPPAAPAPPKPPSVNEGGLKSKRTAAPQSADEPKAKKVHNSQSGISPPPPPPPGDVIENEVDEMPRFPGCEDERLSGMEQDNCSKGKLLNYIFSNIKYPAEARKSGIQGMVVVQFVVEKDGSISNSKILRDIGGGCGKESLRVVDSMNDMKEKWVPGKKEGKITRVAYTLPVKFALGNDKSGKKARENFMKGK
ncbi:MAG: TonB family protein, partial [Bacteroidia bacterium]|nr:TonB family protein [Bacteroidia bacterium]